MLSRGVNQYEIIVLYKLGIPVVDLDIQSSLCHLEALETDRRYDYEIG